MSAIERLNRTFMELKLCLHLYNLILILFKSHLYGIEILFKDSNLVAKDCLNRTFMELK